MRFIAWLALAVPLLLPQAPGSSPTSAPQAVGSKIWIGRYDEFEQFLKTAKIARMEDVGTGVTRPRHAFFEPNGLAAGAVVKNLPPGRQGAFYESYKAEIAAYKL